MMTRIEVTAEDIEQGKAGNYYECPIALAIERRVRPGLYPKVDRRAVKFLASSKLPLPVEARHFILDFDALGVAEPVAFDLDIPDRFLRPDEPREAPSS